jgi:hypothetical protein
LQEGAQEEEELAGVEEEREDRAGVEEEGVGVWGGMVSPIV